MQVPAYWPVEVGIQCVEYKGVFIEVKNVMAIDGESGEEEEEPMSDMEEEEVGDADVVEAMEVIAGDMDMLDIEDMFNLSVDCRLRFGNLCVSDCGGNFSLIYADNETIMSDG